MGSHGMLELDIPGLADTRIKLTLLPRRAMEVQQTAFTARMETSTAEKLT